MSDIVFQDITEFQIAPMRRLIIHFHQGDTIHLYHPVEDSTYDVTPVTRMDHHGCERTLHYAVTISFVALGSNVGEISEAIESRLPATWATLELMPDPGQVNARHAHIAVPSPVGVTCSVTKGQMRPRLTVTITARVKRLTPGGGADLIDDTSQLTDPT